VEIIRQNDFSPPSDREFLKKLDDEPLVVHRRQDGGKVIIIFVHGLGGSRYGEDSTWGPEFLYEDFPDYDAGLYEYRTLLRRLKFWESVSLSDEARYSLGSFAR
jgi:hypothetical protein